MTTTRRFAQVDVFGARPFGGNPVAVVLDAEGLGDAEMQEIATWTNLSETVFLTAPTAPGADYRARIFTPAQELPFAGHPTLGACHAWLEATRDGARPERVVQECGVGLVELRSTPAGLAFASPPLTRSGPVEPETADAIVAALGIAHDDVVAMRWVANGPPWIGVLLASAQAVLDVEPSFVDLFVGVVGVHAPDRIEARAFFPVGGSLVEDPVTGSLNASIAEWLVEDGRVEAPYVAWQGTAIGRSGRVHVTRDDDGGLWIAGATVTCVRGELSA